MQTTRRNLLASAAALPVTAAMPALPAPHPDAQLFAMLEDLTRRLQRESAASAHLDAVYNVLDKATGERPRLPFGVALSDLPEGARERWAERLQDWNRRQQEHPLYAEVEAAAEAWEALNDARRELEEPFRVMPAETVAGVLAKLRNLRSDSAWQDGCVEDWITGPLDQAIIDLEHLAGAEVVR